MCKVFTHRNAKTKNRKTAISRQDENRPIGRMAQMKATDIKDKTSSHSSQNLRGPSLIFLAIYVLETCGPLAPHCARMTNFMKHQKNFIPMYNQSNFQVDIYHRLDFVALSKSAILRSLGSDFPFFLSPGEGEHPRPQVI